MPDLSMKAWLIRLRCDAIGHIPVGGPDSNDFEADFETRAAGKCAAKRAGWQFSGKNTICPTCALLRARQEQ